MMKLTSLSALRAYVREHRAQGKKIAFVPTMGALHEGHLGLVREGLSRADICIPYIFVNPKQFAPHEDFASYPRTVDQDCEKLESTGAQAVYLPDGAQIYPEGFATSVHVSGVSEPLEGTFRPHFFSGVATVVTKMLLQCLPDLALFGEKDYQQLQVIKRFVTDLDIPVEILGVPTVRDENGLALSSRNAYLDETQYKIATHLNRILWDLGNAAHKADPSVIPTLEEKASGALLEAGFQKVDYCTVRDAATLQPPSDTTSPRRVLAAAWLGRARLIDNMPA